MVPVPRPKARVYDCVETRNAVAPAGAETRRQQSRAIVAAMRHMWTRNGAATRLFGVFGVGIAALAIVSQSAMLAALAVVVLVAAAASTRGFPIDRDW